MNIVGYCRVSSTEQIKGTSMDYQEAQIRSYAQFKGLNLVAVFKDPGVSGGKPLAQRPGGAEMTQRLAQGDIQAVVMIKLDRGFRSALDCQITVAKWEQAGIALHFTDMGGIPVDTSTTMGKFMLQVISSCAELEKNMIADRCKAGRKEKRSQGKAIGGTPFGFSKDHNNYLIPNEKEQGIIREIKALSDKGISCNRIAQTLNDKGVATKNGVGKWQATQIQRILRAA